MEGRVNKYKRPEGRVYCYYDCVLQGDIFVNEGVELDRESNELPHDQNGNAAYTFGVSAMDGGSPSQQSYASVSSDLLQYLVLSTCFGGGGGGREGGGERKREREGGGGKRKRGRDSPH